MAAGNENDVKYMQICEKLGFIPREWEPDYVDTEDDSKPNAFSALDPDELMYLLENGYLNKK